MALQYAMERKTFGKTIAEHQAIQLKLAEMSTRAAAAELLVHQAANKFDQQERCDLEAGQAKFFASEAAVQNSLDAMRVFGGYSYSPDYEIERFYRDAPLLCIGEGTNEIQRMIIAKQMVSRAG
jgi:alkylation response protein AidB-like acyl-CoA dehydrogenase